MSKSIMPDSSSSSSSVSQELERPHEQAALGTNWSLLRSYIFMRWCNLLFVSAPTARSEERPSATSPSSYDSGGGDNDQLEPRLEEEEISIHGESPQVTRDVQCDTDSETGLSGAGEHITCQLGSKEQTPPQSLGYFLRKSCCNCIILLLVLSAALSLGFGIKEEGLRTGWYQGVITLNVIIILVLVPSIHHYWHAHSEQLSWMEGSAKKTKLHAQLDRLSNQTQITALIVYIVILVMLFLRFTLRNRDHDSDLPDLEGKSTPIKQFMDAVMKPRGKMSLFTSFTILVAGIVEGLPFVITLATLYWNKKALHGKASARELTACVMMGCVTTIFTDNIGGLTKNALHAFRNAGVDIKLISGDDVSVLETRGCEYDMMMHDSDNKVVIRGEEFRTSTNAERMEIVERISVMGNANLSDKLILMECLKEKGQIVAMVGVGVGAEEARALREADVGITMGTRSTSSDIIVWNGGFSYLLIILGYGRCVYDNIRKYFQLELTVIVAGWLTSFITSGYTSITPFQMCWVNLVVGIFGGMALLTDPPTKKQMEKRPTGPFITNGMWGSIITQVLYQTAIFIAFQFRGKAGLGINEKVSDTMMFNMFLMCQVFNIFNVREREEKNVFRGTQWNLWFWVALGVVMMLQTTFVEIAHKLVGDERLNFGQWVMCGVIGMGSWLVALAEKWVLSFVGSHVGLTSSAASS